MSNQPEDNAAIETTVEQLLALQTQLLTLGEDIYELADACVIAQNKKSANAGSALKRKYVEMALKIDEYKAIVQNYKHILLTDAVFQNAEPDSIAALVAEKYTTGLIIRILLDTSRLKRPSHYIEKVIANSNTTNHLLQRWATELKQFGRFECV